MKTIKEVADQLGINKQRVYRYYIKNCITDAHQTTSPIQLSDAVVNEILQRFSGKTASSDVHHDAHQTASNDTVSDAVYDALLRQLDEKDRQLAAKDQQISDLIEKLDQEQKLHAMTQQKVLMLEEHTDEDAEEEKEVFEKSWFGLYKRVKKK